MSRAPLKQGEFLVESLALVNQFGETLDISGIVGEFTMSESIHRKFVSGVVGIVDGLNLLKNYRFTGQEFIRISVKQKEGIGDTAGKLYSIDKTFRVFKADRITRPTEKIQSYLLSLCEPRIFNLRRTRLSRTLRGSYDDMLENVLVNEAKIPMEEFDHWEETKPDNFQFIVPNWTVNNIIDYCVKESNVGGDTNYRNSMFFFQTLNGGFRFKSIDEMFAQEFPVSFSMKPRNSTNTEDMDLNAPGGLNSQILSYRKPQMFDTLKGTLAGAYASHMKVYDPIRKLESEEVYDIEETFKRGKHLSGHPMIHIGEYEYTFTVENSVGEGESPQYSEIDVDLPPNQHFNAFFIEATDMRHSYDDNKDLTAQELFRGKENRDNATLERIALMEILSQHRIVVTVPFRTDMNAGQIIQLSLPSAEPTSEQDTADKLNDDRYLITDLKLVGSPSQLGGTLTMECVKESYMDKIENVTPLDNTARPREI